MLVFIRKELPFLLLGIAIIVYAIYFSFFTIMRNEKMYAHYFDLGIMHQTVHNTYMSLRTGDFSRILELTDPHDTDRQVKRMSVHNDILLAFLAPFYFIHDGPETLLVVQALGVAMGALFIFLIAEKILRFYNEQPNATFDWIRRSMADKAGWMGLALGLSYLLYSPLQKAVTFEFHAVTLAPTLLLGMYYFWVIKKYIWSFLFAVFAIFSKEQVGLVTGFFAFYTLMCMLSLIPSSIHEVPSKIVKKLLHDKAQTIYALLLGTFSLIWVVFSLKVIIPGFRGGEHFGSDYYSYISGAPLSIFPVVFRMESFLYIHQLLSPLGYLSIFAPLQLLIALPEWGVVLLSANGNMRNIYFHYHAVIDAFIFIAAIYGVNNIANWWKKLTGKNVSFALLLIYILIPAVIASYTTSTLPWAQKADSFPWSPIPAMVDDMRYWREYLQNDSIKVSSTGHLAPHFTSRRYFYDFSWKYTKADYVLIDTHEVQYGFLKKQTIPAYAQLKGDKRYVKIYNKDGLEVYKRVLPTI
ncbi:DUF2079 domain-containing protein [Candidatus Woesebacteria bacterium]|nr:DUF2079 domain-containing protein [Candidatus Woesebacteria bacterium]